jgi:hypothetical protein
MTGVVVEVRIENPHVVFILDVADDTGTVTRWSFEGSTPTAAMRGGYRRDSVKAGDTVTIKGSHARESWLYLGFVRELVLADGRSFLIGPEDLGATP